jgi:hypothetical protein
MAELQSENLTDLEFDFLTRLAESSRPISFARFRQPLEGDHLKGSEVLSTLASLRRRRLVINDPNDREFYLLTKRGENFVLREKLV